MSKKYRGLWHGPSLHALMEKGKVYVECQNCGAHIESWITVMSGKCHKCNHPHGIIECLSKGKQAKETKGLQRAARPYTFVRNILVNGHGVVYGTGRGNQVIVYRAEDAWNYFVSNIFRSRYTCLKCSACGFLHILGLGHYEDVNFAGNLYSVRRAAGFTSGNNWITDFQCLSCGKMNNNIRISVSYDYNVARDKEGNPFGIGPFRRFLIRLSNILP